MKLPEHSTFGESVGFGGVYRYLLALAYTALAPSSLYKLYLNTATTGRILKDKRSLGCYYRLCYISENEPELNADDGDPHIPSVGRIEL